MEFTMKYLTLLFFSLLALNLLTACNFNKKPTEGTSNTITANQVKAIEEKVVTAPIAKKIPHKMVMHDDTRIDNYYWMRDDERKNPELLAHLAAENTYMKAQLSHTEALQKKLFTEIKARIEKDDNSVPVKEGRYFYSTEMHGENEYPIHIRSLTFESKEKETLIDVNKLAEGHDYFSVSGVTASPNEELLSYGVDTLSRRIYTLKFKDLSTGNLLGDEITGTSGRGGWGGDNKTIYYIRKDFQTLLGYQVLKHTLGTPQSDDVLIYEEKDNSYYLSIYKTKDGKVLFINQSSTEAKGSSYIDLLENPDLAKAFVPREEGLEYQVAKHGDWYYVYTNLDAKNFRLMKVNTALLGDKNNWQEVIAHRPNVKLESFELFNLYLTYKEKEQGINRVFVQNFATGITQQLKFNDDAFAAYFYGNNELDNKALRIFYSSLTTPETHYDFDLATGNATTLKQQKVLGAFNPDNYASERFFIEARDGMKVPVSLVYRKDLFNKDGSNPLYQYAYGSYGSTTEPMFSSKRLSLLDRGFVYAIAHVRGSQMLGRPWYEDGKKLTKKNTFNDFIDVTKALTKQGYADKSRVFAVGGSAGGLLMGAIMNQAPELYLGIAAHVPFVDVVTTMLDETIPLTTNEYNEWGNPNEKKYYDYMLSYSPYDQIKAQDYPNVLVTTGLHDSQVQYFEPAKWVAKLREYKTDDNLLLFNVDMSAGHGGASGRFKRLKKSALEYAFFLDLANKNLN
jgi:oligopeptidase B